MVRSILFLTISSISKYTTKQIIFILKTIMKFILSVDADEPVHAKRLVIVNNKGKLYSLNEPLLLFTHQLVLFLHDGSKNAFESAD